MRHASSADVSLAHPDKYVLLTLMKKSTGDNRVSGVSSKQNSRSMVEDPSIATRRLERLAKKLGFHSYREYNQSYRSRLGFATESDYQKYLTKKKGLDSATTYQRYLKTIRSENPEYRKLANLIKGRISELGLSQSDLARRTGISRGMISVYMRAFSYPKPKRLRVILQALQVYDNKPLVGRSHQFGENVRLQKPRHHKYIELSNSINYYLRRFRRDRQWLAMATRIPLQHIILYVEGLIYPRAHRLNRIIDALRWLDTKNRHRRSK
jgi:transcriptional regulator with XRE-family HTH domain